MDFDDDAENAAFVEEVLRGSFSIIEERRGDHLFIEASSEAGGWIVLIDQTSKLADLVIRHSPSQDDLLPFRAAEADIWHRPKSRIASGMLAPAVVDVLLRRARTIFSPKVERDGGHRFWLGILSTCVRRHKKVGLANTDLREVHWFDQPLGVTSWIKAHPLYDPQLRFSALRYVIRR